MTVDSWPCTRPLWRTSWSGTRESSRMKTAGETRGREVCHAPQFYMWSLYILNLQFICNAVTLFYYDNEVCLFIFTDLDNVDIYIYIYK